MKIAAAKYGAGDRWVDVTRLVNILLHYSGEVTVNNELAGDPCPGTWKSCVVRREDGSSAEYQEHETIRLAEIKKTNLIYHVCPFAGGREQWRWNVGQLRKYASWTNGKRVVSVVQGKGIDPVEDVLRELGDFRIDRLIVRVNSDLWEMETFPHALAAIANTNAEEAFFYCHAKGTSKPAGSPQLRAARLWAGYMYRFLFGNSARTLEALNRYSTVGSFKEGDGAFDTSWHFSGTFWGIRHDQLFTRPDWNVLQRHRYFIEFFPSRHFNSQEALNLCPVRRPGDWLDWPSWQRVAPLIEKALQEFGA
jgi:hypothetical protein